MNSTGGSGVLRGKVALVTGASSGLGADFARVLAGKGCELVLVARREDRLQALAQELATEHGVRSHVIPMSLSAKDAPQALYDRVQALGLEVEVLVNNAGFGIWGAFNEIPWEREREMLELDIIALVHLTKLFVKDMVARNSGYVLQVSSVGAYQPSPSYTTYSAAKSFVQNFAEALSYELRDTNVGVTGVAPGVTRTEFLEVSGQKANGFQKISMMESLDVAKQGIEAMLRRKPAKVTGFANAALVFMQRFMPRRLSTATAEYVMRSEPNA